MKRWSKAVVMSAFSVQLQTGKITLAKELDCHNQSTEFSLNKAVGEDTLALPVSQPKKGIYLYKTESMEFCALPEKASSSNLLNEMYLVKIPARPDVPYLTVAFAHDGSEPVISGATMNRVVAPKHRSIKCEPADPSLGKKFLASELENRILRIKKKFDEAIANNTLGGRVPIEKYDFPLIACRGIKGKVGQLASAQLAQIRVAKTRLPATQTE